MNVSNYFDDDGAPVKCPKCQSIKFTEKILGVVDVYHEAEYICECGEIVGFWAYGSWDPSFKDGTPN
jgi:hypothetical protein